MSIQFFTALPDGEALKSYLVCNRRLHATFEHPVLDVFAAKVQLEQQKKPVLTKPHPREHYVQYFSGEVQIFQSKHHISAHRCGEDLRLDISDGLQLYIFHKQNCWLDVNGKRKNQSKTTKNKENIELLAGPVLILPLAWDDVFCLHASAALVKGKLCLFLGDSGKGKSTLAKPTKSDNRNPGVSDWCRVADDIVPVTVKGDQLWALPQLPQIKLSSDEQYGLDLPGELLVDKVYLLDSLEAEVGSGDGFEISKLSVMETTLAILHHTICSKIFPANLLKRHLEFANRFTTIKNISRLRYPKILELLPDLHNRLIGEMQTS